MRWPDLSPFPFPSSIGPRAHPLQSNDSNRHISTGRHGDDQLPGRLHCARHTGECIPASSALCHGHRRTRTTCRQFTNHGKDVDWDAYEKLVLRQIAAGVAGIVAVGTTGESPTLSQDEARKAISEAVRLGKGKVQVIAGTGSNDTAHTVEMTAWAKAAGADACLVVNPYYNRPSQAGLIAHMTAVAAVGLPVMLYNIPGRSGVAMTPATIAT